MVLHINKHLKRKIVSVFIPKFIKRKQYINILKRRYLNKYSSKLKTYELPIYLKIIDTNNIYPEFELDYENYKYYISPFNEFKSKVIKNKFCYNKKYNFHEFNNIVNDLLFYTSSDYGNIQLESILQLFIPNDLDNKDNYYSLFFDYGMKNYNGKMYSYISFKDNNFLTNIFFKSIADKILYYTSFDNLYFGHTALIDFNKPELKYYFVDIEPKLKALLKLYKNKI